LLESVWFDVAASLLERFLGIDVVSGADLAALEACELSLRHIAACSRAMALTSLEDCPRKISIDE